MRSKMEGVAKRRYFSQENGARPRVGRSVPVLAFSADTTVIWVLSAGYGAQRRVGRLVPDSLICILNHLQIWQVNLRALHHNEILFSVANSLSNQGKSQIASEETPVKRCRDVNEVDSSIRKLLKGGRDLYDSLIAAIIRNLKIVKDSSRVIVLDADGTRSKGIARSLRKIGEAEAILEDVSPSPLQLLGYGTNKSTFLFSISCFHLGNLENTSLLIPNTVSNSLSDEKPKQHQVRRFLLFKNDRIEERAATASALCDPALFLDAIGSSHRYYYATIVREDVAILAYRFNSRELFPPLKYQTRCVAAFPDQQEKLRNKSWIDAAGGITNRGRLYGVGKVGSALRLGDAFPNLSCGRSTQESEKILQLEQQVRQSREEARQSREEARQSREQNERLQRQFESLFNVVLPLLPSDTQQLLQQQANMQPDNEDDQQPSSAAGHYGNDY
ncbi:hypothetical protein Fmac_027260 [Flemingia macrophylla]|uniref:Uncharacterized protein n=1 Tax=Flemingia macrophylla TaxID=520843 RepID=A0ABD1LHH3_9FABA